MNKKSSLKKCFKPAWGGTLHIYEEFSRERDDLYLIIVTYARNT